MIMEITVNIENIIQWYRYSTREWCITVRYHTEHVSGVITYCNKRLNKAKSQLFKHLHKDLLNSEIEHLFKENRIVIKDIHNT